MCHDGTGTGLPGYRGFGPVPFYAYDQPLHTMPLYAQQCGGHTPLEFERGWCQRCGRLLTVEPEATVFDEAYERLEAAVERTRIVLRDAAREDGVRLEPTPVAYPLPAPEGDTDAYREWLLTDVRDEHVDEAGGPTRGPKHPQRREAERVAVLAHSG